MSDLFAMLAWLMIAAGMFWAVGYFLFSKYSFLAFVLLLCGLAPGIIGGILYSLNARKFKPIALMLAGGALFALASAIS